MARETSGSVELILPPRCTPDTHRDGRLSGPSHQDKSRSFIEMAERLQVVSSERKRTDSEQGSPLHPEERFRLVYQHSEVRHSKEGCRSQASMRPYWPPGGCRAGWSGFGSKPPRLSPSKGSSSFVYGTLEEGFCGFFELFEVVVTAFLVELVERVTPIAKPRL
jgi:hypothetical protein